MAIRKQEFYEGAALHQLACRGEAARIAYSAPFFLVDGALLVLLKYCTKGRSPWGFTFSEDEQNSLRGRAVDSRVVIGLICGSDGIAAIEYQSFQKIASPRSSAIHIASYRSHRSHYEIRGPDGVLEERIAPSRWKSISS